MSKSNVILQQHHILKKSEYLVLAEDPNSGSKYYEVYYKGKKLNDVTGLIRIKVEDE